MERKRKFLACTCQNRGHFPFSRPFYTTTGLLQYLNRRPIQRRKQGENDGLTLLGVDYSTIAGWRFAPFLSHSGPFPMQISPFLPHSVPFWPIFVGQGGFATHQFVGPGVWGQGISFFSASRFAHDFPSGAVARPPRSTRRAFACASRSNCQNSNGLPSPSCRRAHAGTMYSWSWSTRGRGIG